MTVHALRCALLCAAALTPWHSAPGQSFPPPAPAERARLAEAVRLGEVLRDRLWPGWGAVPVPILLDYYSRVAALGLDGGDTTGRWMLDYPFPYDHPPVQAAVRRLASALVGPNPDLSAALSARRALGRLLTEPQERYLEFQLWQEGTARHVELDAARAAARAPAPGAAFRALPDYERYGETVTRREREMQAELKHLALARQRRVAFYPLGAAMTRLIAASTPDWQHRYAAEPLRLDRLLEAPATR